MIKIKFCLLLIVVLAKADNYCGSQNCYQILGVDQNADEGTIRKAYRQLAKKYHPDKNRDDTTQYFQMINKAYEILTDQKSRFKYNLHLQNPTQSEYYHQYRYYKHHYIEDPKIPPAVVIIGLLLIVSLLQYIMRKQMYERAIESISESHDFRAKVNERCGNNKKIKERVKEQMINEISIEGGYSKPDWKDMLIFKIVILPYSLFLWIKQQTRWIVKYKIKKEPYTKEDSVLLTVKALKLTLPRWSMINEKEQEELLSRKLWEGQNMHNYQEQKRRQYMEQLKQDKPHQYAMMMKYMKKNQ